MLSVDKYCTKSEELILRASIFLAGTSTHEITATCILLAVFSMSPAPEAMVCWSIVLTDGTNLMDWWQPNGEDDRDAEEDRKCALTLINLTKLLILCRILWGTITFLFVYLQEVRLAVLTATSRSPDAQDLIPPTPESKVHTVCLHNDGQTHRQN